ncbi:hypothetical protein IPA_08560 [Ignicoccus pacificus DSM 13166]|uniref:Protein kinase domain-containing protein n=1 Tax=Ignicoccus pacificus DSM 13166 TaxID=940294 RepID=A0A977KC03_9CREN|nr:hypothetical protein IPA_08560 [Ignicoccus pacificus DSM 13166]
MVVELKCYPLEEFPVCYPKENCDFRKELRKAGVECVYSIGKREFKKFRFLGIGFRGVVFLAKWNNIKVAIKVPRTDYLYDMRKEALIQKMAYPIAPKVFEYSRSFIIMEYVPYPDISERISEPLPALKEVLRKVLDAAFTLDMKGIDHGELVRPWKHVLVGERAVILDYGSASLERKPSNLTSIVSGLLMKPSPPASEIARKMGINKAELVEALKLYKKNPSEDTYRIVLMKAHLLC